MGYGNILVCLPKIDKCGFNMKVIDVNRTKRDGKKLYSTKDLPDRKIDEENYIIATLPSNVEMVMFLILIFKK